jgi:hypothetical protein
MGVEVYIVCGDYKLKVSKRGILKAINSKGQLEFSDGTLLALANSIVELYVGVSSFEKLV